MKCSQDYLDLGMKCFQGYLGPDAPYLALDLSTQAQSYLGLGMKCFQSYLRMSRTFYLQSLGPSPELRLLD